MENKTNPEASLLEFEPKSIDFGSVAPGEGPSVALKIRGGPGKVSVHCDQLKASLTDFKYGDNTLVVTLIGGSSGELIWDEVILQTDTQEFSVPVTARWTEKVTDTSLEQNIETTLAQQKDKETSPKQGRTFRGKSCSICSRNFGYNLDTGSWDQCTCTKYQMVVNMSSRIVKELRYGLKDIPSYLQELWRVIRGEEKW